MREIGWLIEVNLPSSGSPSWLWLGQYGACWTEDSNVALRFARECDAKAYLSAHAIPDYRTYVTVTEHVWADGAGIQQSASLPEAEWKARWIAWFVAHGVEEVHAEAAYEAGADYDPAESPEDAAEAEYECWEYDGESDE